MCKVYKSSLRKQTIQLILGLRYVTEKHSVTRFNKQHSYINNYLTSTAGIFNADKFLLDSQEFFLDFQKCFSIRSKAEPIYLQEN